MKRWKKWVVVILALLSVTATCLTLGNIFSEKKEERSDIAYIGPTPNLMTDKTVYKVGEPIMVTYTTDNLMDRICITLVSDPKQQIRWCYIGAGYDGDPLSDGNGSGVPVDITTRHVTGAYSGSEWASFPAGEYVVFVFPASGGNVNVTERVYITIEE